MHPPARSPHPNRLTTRAGFTLIEMLVVVSIIVILIGILVPVIGKVRQQAMATDTNARIQSLATAIQAYYGDFHAYPGPVPNAQLRVAGDDSSNPKGCGIVAGLNDVGKMSMAENLYLGLLGGIDQVAPATTPATFRFDATKAGTGPHALGGLPKKYPAYTDNTGITKDAAGTGKFVDDDGNAADDTEIPEFLDQFTAPMPLLYLRAKVQAPGVASENNHTGGSAPDGGANPVQQYDLAQVRSYTTTMIGVGRSVAATAYKNHPAQNTQPHGLSTCDPTACIGAAPTTPAGLKEVYPYDLYAAVLDPTIQRQTATAAAPANTPRQKDGFILISAGIDRVYGTEDDITNFGKW
jgi:prepilin-type N-terminal cleavage/methylation domain-containing protein